MSDRLRVAVVGVGHQGSHYARSCARHGGFELVGLADRRVDWGREIGHELGVPCHADAAELLGRVDAVCVVAPAREHFPLARMFLDAGVHVLVEKPMVTSLEEGRELVDHARRGGALLQVAYLERKNPIFTALRRQLEGPLFLSAERSCPFSVRPADVGIVYDHMIHDLDLVLHLNPSEVVEVEATGARLVSSLEDVAHARLRFADGGRAELAANRLWIRKLGLMGVLTREAYLAIDLDGCRADIYRRRRDEDSEDPGDPHFSPKALHGHVSARLVDRQSKSASPVNAIEAQLWDFHDAIVTGQDLGVTGADDLRTLEVADRIVAALASSEAREIRAAG